MMVASRPALKNIHAEIKATKLTIKNNSTELVIDLMSKTALTDSEELTNFIYSQIMGLGIPISIDNY